MSCLFLGEWSLECVCHRGETANKIGLQDFGPCWPSDLPQHQNCFSPVGNFPQMRWLHLLDDKCQAGRGLCQGCNSGVIPTVLLEQNCDCKLRPNSSNDPPTECSWLDQPRKTGSVTHAASQLLWKFITPHHDVGAWDDHLL